MEKAEPVDQGRSDGRASINPRFLRRLLLAGMSANLCVESYLRDGEEKGYEVIVINDDTAAAGDDAYKAALTNYGFIAHESITADEAIRRLDRRGSLGKKPRNQKRAAGFPQLQPESRSSDLKQRPCTASLGAVRNRSQHPPLLHTGHLLCV